MDARALAELAQLNAEKYYADSADFNSLPGFTLWQLALSSHERGIGDFAWSAVVDIYGQQVRAWIAERSKGGRLPMERLKHDTFVRFWRAAQKHAEWQSLAHIMSYLRMCTHSAINDYLRDKQARREHVPLDNIERLFVGGLRPMEGGGNVGAWLDAVNANDDERVIVECVVCGNIAPRALAELMPERFTTRQIYRTKENVLNRLRRAAV